MPATNSAASPPHAAIATVSNVMILEPNAKLVNPDTLLTQLIDVFQRLARSPTAMYAMEPVLVPAAQEAILCPVALQPATQLAQIPTATLAFDLNTAGLASMDTH